MKVVCCCLASRAGKAWLWEHPLLCSIPHNDEGPFASEVPGPSKGKEWQGGGSMADCQWSRVGQDEDTASPVYHHQLGTLKEHSMKD